MRCAVWSNMTVGVRACTGAHTTYNAHNVQCALASRDVWDIRVQGMVQKFDSWGAAVTLMQMHTGRAPCAFLSKAELLVRYNPRRQPRTAGAAYARHPAELHGSVVQGAPP